MTELFSLLDRVAHKARRIHERTVQKTGYSPVQYLILRALGGSGQLSPSGLAERLGCTRATMTGLLDTLQRRDLVTRQPNPRDRRSFRIVLTAEGRAAQRRAPRPDQGFCACCLGLSETEVDSLMRLLTKLDLTLEPEHCWSGQDEERG